MSNFVYIEKISTLDASTVLCKAQSSRCNSVGSSRVSLTGGRPRLVKSMGALIIVKSSWEQWQEWTIVFLDHCKTIVLHTSNNCKKHCFHVIIYKLWVIDTWSYLLGVAIQRGVCVSLLIKKLTYYSFDRNILHIELSFLSKMVSDAWTDIQTRGKN